MIDSNAVRQWMAVAQQPGRDKPTAELYEKLVQEEFHEFQDAYMLAEAQPDNLIRQADVLDGIVDTIWCLIGLGHAMGLDVDGAFFEVTRSNRSKIDPVTYRVEKDANGKVKKPESYTPPDLMRFVRQPVQMELDLTGRTAEPTLRAG